MRQSRGSRRRPEAVHNAAPSLVLALPRDPSRGQRELLATLAIIEFGVLTTVAGSQTQARRVYAEARRYISRNEP